MPVIKYRSFADMPPPEPSSEGQLASRIRVLWSRAFLLCPPARKRGVRRFRSIAEANRERTRETAERMTRRAREP
jgi:hypothetical protein